MKDEYARLQIESLKRENKELRELLDARTHMKIRHRSFPGLAYKYEIRKVLNLILDHLNLEVIEIPATDSRLELITKEKRNE